MSQSVVNNYNKEITDSYGLYAYEPATNAGFGSQFILYTAAVVSKAKVKMTKSLYGETAPVGTVKARLYGSELDVFRDPNDYASGLIAESTDSIDLANLDANEIAEVEFTFANVELAAGVYFICFFSADYVRNDGILYIMVTEQASSAIGYVTFWWESEGRWGSWIEWD